MIIVWLWRPMWSLVIASFAAAAFLVAVFTRGPVLIEELIEVVLPNISEFFGADLVDNARMNTLGIVSQQLAENYFMGLGAVSLLHDGGLARIFGRNFFINDVGVFGELFRVGVGYLGFFWVYVAMSLQSWKRMRLPKDRALVGGLFLFCLLVGPTDGLFYRMGFLHAFLFLLMKAGAEGSTDLSHARGMVSQPAAYRGAY
jgi:hypothetical protein